MSANARSAARIGITFDSRHWTTARLNQDKIKHELYTTEGMGSAFCFEIRHDQKKKKKKKKKAKRKEKKHTHTHTQKKKNKQWRH